MAQRNELVSELTHRITGLNKMEICHLAVLDLFIMLTTVKVIERILKSVQNIRHLSLQQRSEGMLLSSPHPALRYGKLMSIFISYFCL